MAFQKWFAILKFECKDSKGIIQKNGITLNFLLNVGVGGFTDMQAAYNSIRGYIGDNIGGHCANTIDNKEKRVNTSLVSCYIGKVEEVAADLKINGFTTGDLPAGQNANKVRRNHILFFKSDNEKRQFQIAIPEPTNDYENKDIINNIPDCPFTLFFDLYAGNFKLCDSRFNPLSSFSKSKFKTTK